jgi:O-antigen chain-terminating methyltransferase
MDEKLSLTQAKISSEMDEKLSLTQAKLASEIEENVRTKIAIINGDIENKAWLAKILENKSHATKIDAIEESHESIDYINYFVFSDEMSKIWTKLSGKSVDTPNIFIDSIELFKDCKNVLDIGCGSGYFLKMMKQNNIGGYGIDLNEDLVAYCQKMGINAIKIDALSHLQSIENKSLDGIFINQVAEHLSIDNLIKLLKSSYEKLQYGSYIIITIPNILSMLVSTNLYYLDPTHQRQLHPEVLKFLLNSCGFRDIQEKYYQPIPDDIKLKKLEISDYSQEENLKKIIENYNNNVTRLNNILFGFRDVTVLGKK